jgi:putative transposase
MYNAEHHHVGLGLLTPVDVHHGLAEQRVAERATVLATAYAAHPERFPGGLPHPPVPPVEVWINRPKTRAIEEVSYTPILALGDRSRRSLTL